MMRRTLLTASVVLIVGALAPELPAEARMDPAAFINNLGHQLQMVTSNTSPEQRLAGFRELFREDFDVPGLGRFVLGRSRNFSACSRITSCSPIVTACRNSPTAAKSPR